MGKQTIDLTGNHYGLLQVIEKAGSRAGGGATWKCLCLCGTTKVVDGANLRYGRTNSCGCQIKKKHHFTHQKSKTKIHNIWCGMRQRCENANSRGFAHYGGRGIAVCDRWQVFENFLEDMGIPPTGASLDRIDNDKGYNPENCRWANMATQVRNRRITILVQHEGVHKTLKELERLLGVPYKTLHHRYSIGKRGHDLLAPLRSSARITARN